MEPIVSKQPGPAECAQRSAAPACRARRARHSFAVCFCCLFACLGLSVPVLLVLAVLVPLLKSSPPGPTFRQAASFGCSPALLFALFSHLFSTSFFIDFFSVLASILAPKIDPKPEKNGKNRSSTPALFFNRFSIAFSIDFGLLLDRPNP